jgi:hypothetical protein
VKDDGNNDSERAVLRFIISPQDRSRDEQGVRKALQEAIAEAVAEASERGESVEAHGNLAGGFLGAGEIAAVIFVAKSVGGGFLAAAGKAFFDQYVKPRLVRMNLLTSEPSVETAAGSERVPANLPPASPRAADKK